jgi:hypothetical protein
MRLGLCSRRGASKGALAGLHEMQRTLWLKQISLTMSSLDTRSRGPQEPVMSLSDSRDSRILRALAARHGSTSK